MMRRMEEVSRETLERIAGIIGPRSAAAQVLAVGDQMEDPVYFQGNGSFFVGERTPAPKQEEPA